MPASPYEMVRSLDGATIYALIYGGGVFGNSENPDCRIAVIDLATKSLKRILNVGGNFEPHSLMMDEGGTLWASAELADAVLIIDPVSGGVERVALAGALHSLAISHATGKLFASLATREAVAVVDLEQRKIIDLITIPSGSAGIAVSPDGYALYVCAYRRGEVHAFDTRTHALHLTARIDGAPAGTNQSRRVRTSPDGRHVCVASQLDNYAAVYDGMTLAQLAGFPTPRAPTGFGFAADGTHAYLCCQDAAEVLEFALGTGRIRRKLATAAGCEFVISY